MIHVFNIACRVSGREIIIIINIVSSSVRTGRGFGESDEVDKSNVTWLSGEVDFCLTGGSVPLSI